MIYKYKIKEENNKQVLYIYLEEDYEFSLSSFDKEKIKQEIKDKLKQINFTGDKIKIVSCGLVLATILLTNNVDIPKEEEHHYVTNQIVEEIINIKQQKPYAKLGKIKQQEVKIKATTKQSKKSSSSNKSSSVKKYSSSKKASTSKKSTNKSATSKKSTNKSSTSKKSTNKSATSKKKSTTSSEKKTATNTNKTMVTIYRSSGKVEKIELEEYLIGVVAGEMPASFNTEALKAQAILARTYTLKSMQTGKKLTDTTSTQVYKDNNELKKLWKSDYTTYYNKIKKAVNATKGYTVKYNGKYIEALYHSTSNGYTENSENVFTYSYPYLKTVESPWDKKTSSYQKTITMKYTDALNKLGIKEENVDIKIISRNKSGRVSKIKVGSKEFTGAKFRMLLGLRSADFDIKLNNNNLKITTRGYGHGVGMSQYGANGMAKEGKTYEQIIKYYYKGVSISK